MKTALSFGAGVQTTALLVLIATGRWPRPDRILFSDTGTEHTETYAYLGEISGPYAREHGLEIIVLGPDWRTKHYHADLETYCLEHRMLPGTWVRWCTDRYKVAPMIRFLKRIMGATSANPVESWIGISADEQRRAKLSSDPLEVKRYPLIELGLSRQDCEAIIRDAGLPVPPKSGCWFCLTGETEVVTRDGVQRIADLAGTTPELLVPTVGSRGGLSEVGCFRPAPIRSFGRQPVYAITVRRGRTVKTIRATAAHEWLLAPGKKWSQGQTRRTTVQLKPGDRLKALRAAPLASEEAVPFAIAQGFVFGDGTKGQGDRPASLDLHAGKDDVLLPLFQVCGPKPRVLRNGKTVWRVHSLPRSWKSLPDVRESRSFLLGWLAGYFAADGTVGVRGQATLYSANRDHLMFARSVCAILGIQTNPVLSRVRKGFDAIRPLHSFTFSHKGVPPEFFLLPHHKARVTATSRRAIHWRVVSVACTGTEEEVYCATVDDRGAFGLADGLMTGNCPFQRQAKWHQLKRESPDLFARALAMEKNARGKDGSTRYLPMFGSLERVAAQDELPGFDAAVEAEGGCVTGSCFV